MSDRDSAAPIHERRGRITGAVMFFHDVSAAKQMSFQLSHLAQHDFLTDLPNRMLLHDRLEQAITWRGATTTGAVLFLIWTISSTSTILWATRSA